VYDLQLYMVKKTHNYICFENNL